MVFRILSLYYEAYTSITDFIRVLQNLYLSYGTYTCISEYIIIFRILSLYYGAYTCITKLILVLQSIYLSYESYSCAKVTVGTISWNKS